MIGPRRAIVLAGRRPGVDALAAGDGAPHRALLDIAGEPMIVRVTRRLLDWPSIERVVFCCFGTESRVLHEQALAATNS